VQCRAGRDGRDLGLLHAPTVGAERAGPAQLRAPPRAGHAGHERRYAPPASDQAYLDTVLDGLVAFVDASSYGRAVLAIDVAGTDPATANRWYRTGLSPEKANYAGLLVPGETPRPLDDYEIISTFATNSGHSVEVICNNIGTVASKSCNIVYAYRRPDLAPFAMDVHHENGHSLRLAHDRAFSSLTGYGPTRSTFQGEWQPYGGRSSVMRTATDAAYNLQERVSAGWLNDGISGAGRHVVSVTSGSVTTTIDELEQDVEGIKGVYVPVTGGNYWIETRGDPSLEPILQTGVILHFASDAGSHFGGMIDGTPETPADALVDGTLPIGRTFADTANHVYITALSQTATTTKVRFERDPVDPNPPVIASVEAIDCATQPTKCPNLPPTTPGLGLWRFQVTASDADGDALSHAWRFGVGTNGVADATSYQAGAAVYRWQRVDFRTGTEQVRERPGVHRRRASPHRHHELQRRADQVHRDAGELVHRSGTPPDVDAGPHDNAALLPTRPDGGYRGAQGRIVADV
jgi:hypothetical protein